MKQYPNEIASAICPSPTHGLFSRSTSFRLVLQRKVLAVLENGNLLFPRLIVVLSEEGYSEREISAKMKQTAVHTALKNFNNWFLKRSGRSPRDDLTIKRIFVPQQVL